MGKMPRKAKTAASPGGQRPIDKLRNGAFSIEINPLEDKSPISESLTIDERLHVLKKKGVYHIRLADEIDPERKNINVPNTVQRVLRMGSDSELVGRTLLTGKTLFNSNYLPKEVDCEMAMTLLLALVRSLVAMSMAADALCEREKQTLEAGDVSRRKDGSVLLPDVGIVEAECKAFLQQAGHCLRELLEIVKLFYRGQKFSGWFDSFRTQLDKFQERDDGFIEFLDATLPLLRFINNARNCIEHPKKTKFVRVTDFFINEKGELVSPIIEVVHPDTPQKPISASRLMTVITEDVTNAVESMIVFLCRAHAQPFAGMQTSVIQLPKERIRDSHVHFGYGVWMNGEIRPIG